MHISEIDTPAILIDLDAMERNLERVAAYSRAHGLRLRPHTKTHKIPALGRRQIESGAVGLTVAKVSEAAVMLESEPEDLLIAYPIVGARKLERLADLARRTRVTVSLDSVEAARGVAEAASRAGVRVGVLAEFDAGLRRVGVEAGEPLRQLVEAIEREPPLDFEGIAFYPGHIKMLDDNGDEELARLSSQLDSVVCDLQRAGFNPKIVSGGSTPTLWRSHEVARLNEIRPGTYIFNDRNTAACGACELEDCAASVLATVVSTSVKGQMIIDGGSKTFSSDRLVTGTEGFGLVVDVPGAVFTKMNEEHGFVELREGASFRVGDRVRVIPNHICAAMNLHEQVYGIRADRVEEVWKVEGRGKLQ